MGDLEGLVVRGGAIDEDKTLRDVSAQVFVSLPKGSFVAQYCCTMVYVAGEVWESENVVTLRAMVSAAAPGGHLPYKASYAFRLTWALHDMAHRPVSSSVLVMGQIGSSGFTERGSSDSVQFWRDQSTLGPRS